MVTPDKTLLNTPALIVALGPLWLFIATLVRLSSPGPIIHRRRVLACGGGQFDAYKLRTMVADADRRLRQDRTLRDEFARQSVAWGR